MVCAFYLTNNNVLCVYILLNIYWSRFADTYRQNIDKAFEEWSALHLGKDFHTKITKNKTSEEPAATPRCNLRLPDGLCAVPPVVRRGRSPQAAKKALISRRQELVSLMCMLRQGGQRGRRGCGPLSACHCLLRHYFVYLFSKEWKFAVNLNPFWTDVSFPTSLW